MFNFWTPIVLVAVLQTYCDGSYLIASTVTPLWWHNSVIELTFRDHGVNGLIFLVGNTSSNFLTIERRASHDNITFKLAGTTRAQSYLTKRSPKANTESVVTRNYREVLIVIGDVEEYINWSKSKLVMTKWVGCLESLSINSKALHTTYKGSNNYFTNCSSALVTYCRPSDNVTTTSLNIDTLTLKPLLCQMTLENDIHSQVILQILEERIKIREYFFLRIKFILNEIDNFCLLEMMGARNISTKLYINKNKTVIWNPFSRSHKNGVYFNMTNTAVYADITKTNNDIETEIRIGDKRQKILHTEVGKLSVLNLGNCGRKVYCRKFKGQITLEYFPRRILEQVENKNESQRRTTNLTEGIFKSKLVDFGSTNMNLMQIVAYTSSLTSVCFLFFILAGILWMCRRKLFTAFKPPPPFPEESEEERNTYDVIDLVENLHRRDSGPYEVVHD